MGQPLKVNNCDGLLPKIVWASEAWSESLPFNLGFEGVSERDRLPKTSSVEITINFSLNSFRSHASWVML